MGMSVSVLCHVVMCCDGQRSCLQKTRRDQDVIHRYDQEQVLLSAAERFVPKSFEVGPLTNFFSTSSNSIEEAFVFAFGRCGCVGFFWVSRAKPRFSGPEVLRTRVLEASGAFNSPVFENGAPSKWKIGLFLGFWGGSVRDLWAIPMLTSRPGPRLGAPCDPRFGRKHGH